MTLKFRLTDDLTFEIFNENSDTWEDISVTETFYLLELIYIGFRDDLESDNFDLIEAKYTEDGNPYMVIMTWQNGAWTYYKYTGTDDSWEGIEFDEPKPVQVEPVKVEKTEWRTVST